jgi:hypothetical protein
MYVVLSRLLYVREKGNKSIFSVVKVKFCSPFVTDTLRVAFGSTGWSKSPGHICFPYIFRVLWHTEKNYCQIKAQILKFMWVGGKSQCEQKMTSRHGNSEMVRFFTFFFGIWILLRSAKIFVSQILGNSKANCQTVGHIQLLGGTSDYPSFLLPLARSQGHPPPALRTLSSAPYWMGFCFYGIQFS